MTGRAEEVVDALHRRHIDVCCIQKTRWKGNGARTIDKTSEKYKFLWQGSNDGKAGVGILRVCAKAEGLEIEGGECWTSIHYDIGDKGGGGGTNIVNDKWEVIKKTWVMTTKEVCGWTKGPPRHKGTWWWNPKIAKAMDEK
ncbi:uncharacterized protein LOC135927710 [Gordionus sp. m RMFG-2023]|uniref:uncharacterized protein LOC135927710 n=1 Tax=Gordionus sp. m RMFG-2023 TaxID=3053472 RepID=UPI0031FD622B